MALMFQRNARNFAKNGYFPTDAATLERIIAALDVTEADGPVFMLDPCCGEGSALAEIKHSLSENGATGLKAYGVEYNAERAWHAKSLLDIVAHADIHDMAIKPRGFGLLFLNPPYGDLVSDKAGLSDAVGVRQRLEKVFFNRTHPWLAFDGVLVLIVPYSALDADLAGQIARSYTDVRCFMAPEQRFSQCVIFGRKRKSASINQALTQQLQSIGQGALPPTLPEVWAEPRYRVPCGKESPHFVSAGLNPAELSHEVQRMQRQTLWPQFATHFAGLLEAHRPPLRRLSNWHLALALAAGQVNGVVCSKSGRSILVMGDTYKTRTEAVSFEEGDSGDIREVRTLTDRFVPSIRGIDLTPGDTYGDLIAVR